MVLMMIQGISICFLEGRSDGFPFPEADPASFSRVECIFDSDIRLTFYVPQMSFFFKF